MAKCYNCKNEEATETEGDYEGLGPNCMIQAGNDLIWIETHQSKVQDALEALQRLGNDTRIRDRVCTEVNRMHRTEQQLLMGTIMEILEGWAKQYEKGAPKKGGGWYDPRNEDTVEMAYAMVTHLKTVKPNNFFNGRWHLAYI